MNRLLFRVLLVWATGLTLAAPLSAYAGSESDINAAYFAGDKLLLEALRADLEPDSYLSAYLDWRLGSLLFEDNTIEQADAILLRAEETLVRLTAANPESAEAWALLSVAIGMRIGVSPGRRGMKMGPASGKAGKRAEKLEPDNPRVLLIIGINKFNTPALFGGGKKKAMKYLNKSLASWQEYGPGAQEWGESDIYTWRGQTHQKMGDEQSACADYAAALKLSPGFNWVKSLHNQLECPELPRADAMTIRERAAWIDRLQAGRTSREDEALIVDAFLRTYGRDLTELKDRIDAGEDHRDLQQLVYHDLDDDEQRNRLLTHLLAEAATVRRDYGSQGVKVLSDIDDTIYPNYADKRAWSLGDAPYPGVVAFYDALTGSAPSERSRLTLISARPYDRAGLLENHGAAKLNAMGLPRHSILSGDAWTLLTIASGTLGERAIDEVGDEKLRNFLQWSGLMGEYDIVISGDRTQADHIFAAGALAHENGTVLAAFIHDVGDQPRQDAARLFYNDTVLGHALDAFDGGWIDRQGLVRVRDTVAAGKLANVYPPELAPAVERDLARAELVLVRGK